MMSDRSVHMQTADGKRNMQVRMEISEQQERLTYPEQTTSTKKRQKTNQKYIYSGIRSIQQKEKYLVRGQERKTIQIPYQEN